MKHTLSNWRLPFLEATVISSFILGLFYYWYGLADRYAIFLYGHTTVNIPPAQPFDEITRSRYWMAGLVATGAVLALYTAANWLWGRLAAWRNSRFTPAAWQRVWLISALPLAIGIPAITMTVNWPTLPPILAAACVVATLSGLAVALLPGKWAAERPAALAWLAADGLGLMPPLLLLRVVELPGRGLSVGYTTAWLVALGGLAAGAAWLAGMSLLRLWRRPACFGAAALLLAGLALSYLLLPLVHHLLATPPAYRYISAAGNFFAFNWPLQLLALLTAAALAAATAAARRRLWPHLRS